ncbi:Glycosyl hydrolase family 92 [Planctomycetes bacterium CA13]|uniref:Glycosyl hydrolase family 92 n=1 Tax=Novipirellula herctigrandis TaxID=2527986 RepID=A0A5C5YVX6_9BACT|nr:Glycosyl hydrolase family 92 [Planctomycetes bacterium CA13]
MIRQKLVLTLLLLPLFLAETATAETDYAELVRPLIGTDSEVSFSNGNTYPAVATPFGMTFWTPRTGDETGWIYQYKADRMRGFHATHQPSPWMGDYGNFGVMPFTGVASPELPSSAFSHDTEESKAYYYGVTLEDSDIRAEMTATTRCSVMRFRYPDQSRAWVHLDTYAPGSFEADEEAGIIKGVGPFNRGGVEGDFGCRFVAHFSVPIRSIYRSPDGHWVAVELELPASSTAEVKFGTSFISHEQATVNLNREIGEKSFDDVVAVSKAVWNKRLNVIDIEGASQDQRITFYSNLYRALLFPRILHEENEAGDLVHYSPYSGKVEPGEMYGDNGFWDTFRAVYPLLSIIDPEINASMVRGWINAYKEGGWFPKWASPGYRDCMIGTHVESVIADALCKGINDFDLEAAAEASIKDATALSDNNAYGRKGLKSYLERGYVASDETGEATARTLEFAYDDWCVALVCKYAGRTDVIPQLLERAQNYRNVFDPKVGLMRGRQADGSWRPDFKADEWGGPFTEGCSWHYSWSVLHDMPGLIELMGGDKAFVAKLDAMLAAEPTFGVGHYGGVIHEMTEMVACKMGQYAHGNQPVHHVLYLYNFAGEPWKTAAPVRQVVDTLYGPGPDGYCGDEDNGQMSAWYLFSTLGFYPVCPGKAGYVIGSPRFPKATIHLPGGGDFVIEASGVSDKAIHIEEARIDDQSLSRSWIKHEEIAAGSTLSFKMSEQPNKSWGTSPADRPFGEEAK